MLTALAEMARQNGGALKGILLDLRDNPGGLLKSAVAVSSVFLPDDSLVVYTESATAQSRMRLQAQRGTVPALKQAGQSEAAARPEDFAARRAGEFGIRFGGGNCRRRFAGSSAARRWRHTDIRKRVRYRYSFRWPMAPPSN